MQPVSRALQNMVRTGDIFKNRKGMDKVAKSSQHLAFENIIVLLIHHGRFHEAGVVHGDMLDAGFIPSPATNADMLAIALVTDPSDERAIHNELAECFRHHTFDDHDLSHLISFMRRLAHPPRTIIPVVSIYLAVKAQDTAYRPSQTIISDFVELQEARITLRQYQGRTVDVDETELLASLADQNEDSGESNARLVRAGVRLASMRADVDAHLDVHILNALIHRQINHERWDLAYALYTVLLELGARTPVRPDGETFQTVFYAATRLYKPVMSTRSAALRQEHAAQVPENAVPPWRVFRDMMRFQFNRVYERPWSSASVAQASLVSALRALLATSDYAGAHVALRQFAERGIAVPPQVYLYVARHLTKRLRNNVAANSAERAAYAAAVERGNAQPREDDPTPRWFSHLLGEGAEVDMADDAAVAALLVHRGQQPVAELADPPPAAGEPPAQVPLYAHMVGKRPLPPRTFLSTIPLENLMRRAMFLSVPKARRWEYDESPERAHALVEAKIEESRREMIPEGVELWTWQQDWRKTPPTRHRRKR
ncbi:hypothetical protein BD626DRAFT_519073 [Schizophyllum amplum]|uniref:Uncharacterized protein n=1 Tax=Schizophyllum amplum TaxID=97359 RepID=A0A550BVJ6_9AGAR|nr:hypothetical protein BD626DRAFT_519073 [Auriculariopsis ampla]